jgi:serine/threonine protein kinase
MYVSQVVKALIYIHQQGTIHRDLKLGNILINDQM